MDEIKWRIRHERPELSVLTGYTEDPATGQKVWYSFAYNPTNLEKARCPEFVLFQMMDYVEERVSQYLHGV